jgi:site-specific recombinase XerD
MSGDLDTLLAQFLRERKYLHNLRPQPLEWYETAWKAFRKSATSCLTDPKELNRSHLEQFIYTLRDRDVRPVTCNTWLWGPNAFRRWAARERAYANGGAYATAEGEKRLVETLATEYLRCA